MRAGCVCWCGGESALPLPGGVHVDACGGAGAVCGAGEGVRGAHQALPAALHCYCLR